MLPLLPSRSHIHCNQLMGNLNQKVLPEQGIAARANWSYLAVGGHSAGCDTVLEMVLNSSKLARVTMSGMGVAWVLVILCVCVCVCVVCVYVVLVILCVFVCAFVCVSAYIHTSKRNVVNARYVNKFPHIFVSVPEL